MRNLDWFSNSSWSWFSNNNQDYDWEALKKEGTVTETIEEKDGYKTIIRTFISFDGKTKIISSESLPIIDEIRQKLLKIEKEIKLAVKNENYEKAAELKKQKDNLLNNKK